MKRIHVIVLAGVLILIVGGGIIWQTKRGTDFPLLAPRPTQLQSPEPEGNQPAKAVEEDDPQLIAFSNERADIHVPRPDIAIVDQRRPRADERTPEPSQNVLNEEDRLIVEEIFASLNDFMESIDSLDFDLEVTSSVNPRLAMKGHVSSTEIDTFNFSGLIHGNETESTIAYRDGTNILTGEGLPENYDVDFSELSDIFWATPLRQKGVTDAIDEVKKNEEIATLKGEVLVCKRLNAPNVSLFFEESANRLVETRMNYPEQTTTSRIEYDKESGYPSRVVVYPSCPVENEDDFTAFEFSNISIIPKERDAER